MVSRKNILVSCIGMRLILPFPGIVILVTKTHASPSHFVILYILDGHEEDAVKFPTRTLMLTVMQSGSGKWFFVPYPLCCKIAGEKGKGSYGNTCGGLQSKSDSPRRPWSLEAFCISGFPTPRGKLVGSFTILDLTYVDFPLTYLSKPTVRMVIYFFIQFEFFPLGTEGICETMLTFW